MADQLVETIRTPITIDNYTRAVVRAWHVVGGGFPKKEAVGVLYAQYIMETGGRDVWNFNLGNSKEVPNDGINYQMLKGVWEGFSKAVADGYVARGEARYDTNPGHIAAVAPRIAVVFDPPHPMTWFSAFKSLEEAMEYHLKFLALKRYKTAWPAVLTGEVQAFANGLKAMGYFTASEVAYAAGMKPAFANYMKSGAYEKAVAELAEQGTPVDLVEPTPEDMQLVVIQPDLMNFVEVECDGERWLVAPMYSFPVGIGEALRQAEAIGFTLPTVELVDAIYAAADLKVDSEKLIYSKVDGSDFTPRTMDAPATHALTFERLMKEIDGRRLGVDFKLMAGGFKDVCFGLVKDENGNMVRKLGIYGAQRANGKVIQGFNPDHVLDWRDYLQGARYVRKLS